MERCAGRQVADYLEASRDALLETWTSHVIVGHQESQSGFLKVNGRLMLNLVIDCTREMYIDEERIKNLAHKVSMERIEATSTIADFIYNTTIGRSDIVDLMPDVGLTMEELHPVLHIINRVFDMFLHHAVHDYTDVSNKKIAEQTSFIEQSHKDKLTILGQMSSSFVHEFRNPLTSVIGFIQLLREKYPNLEYMDVINKELSELRFRINQFLLVSRRGEDHKQQVEFEVAQIVNDTLEFLYPMVVSANARLRHEVPRQVKLRGYPDEVRQVLINIIMNSLDALSSCTEKEIIIKGRTEDKQIVLSISNNGPAIPPAMLPTIFEPFVTGKELGTGIGLYLCRVIVLRHNGTIECESNDDWTTFRITLPTV